MTLLTWINHSGFQIESKSGKKLISDPWLNSSIRNNSWDLLVQSAMRPDELGAADAYGSHTNIQTILLLELLSKYRKANAAI